MRMLRKFLLSGFCIILSVLGMAGTAKAAMEVTVNPEVSVNITVEDDSGKIIGDDSVEMRMYNSNGREVAQWYCNNSDYISTTMVNCKAGGTFYRDVASIVPYPSESDVTISQFNIHGGYYNDLQGKFSFRYNTYYNGWLKYKVNEPEAVALTIPAGKMMISVPECFAGRKLEYAISVNAKDSTYGGTKYIFNDIAGQETYYELEPATYYTFSSLWAEKTGAMGSTGQITVSGQPTNYIRKTINISDYTGGDFESGDKYVLTYDGEEVVFDYADEGDERGFLLYIISGSVVNVVTPDKAGNVTIYVEQTTNTASYWGACMWKTGSGRYDYQNASVESGIIDMYIKKDIRFYTLQIPQYGMTFANIPEGEYTIEQSKQIPGYIMPEPMKITVRADGIFYKCPMVNVRCDSLYYVEDEWRYYVDGTFASDYTGIVTNGAGKWYVENGVQVPDANGLYLADGVWYYLRGGKVCTDYVGFVENSGGKWFVINGMIDTSCTGIYKVGDYHWYIKNGKANEDFEGLYNHGGSWWYIKNGVIQTGYQGVVNYGDNWWYVKGGRVQNTYEGLVVFGGNQWYVKGGRVQNTYVGIVKYDGDWWYVSGGKVNRTFVGLYSFNGSWWYIKNGKIQVDYNGLVNYGGNWWYVKGGRVQNAYEGMVKSGDAWWYVKGGKIQSSFTGIVNYSGNSWYVTNGKIATDYSGLGQSNGVWYCIQGGKVNYSFTGFVKNNDSWWYVNNGILNTSVTGLVKVGDYYWLVGNGKLNNTYTGKYTYGGKIFMIVNGKVII